VRAILAAGLLGLVAALWTWTLPGDPALTDDPDGVPVRILNNGFHTDLAFPREVLEARPGPLGEVVRDLGPGDWVLIGWGDAVFYVDQSPIEGRLLDGARAFFAPGNRSVVMLDPAPSDPAKRFATRRRNLLVLSPRAVGGMLDRIEASLELTDGHARLVARRPGDDARFFASRERFWIGHLCNHWTARVLNAGGVDVRPLRSITAWEVMSATGRRAGESSGDAVAD